MHTNPVRWFEIYVQDMPRARKFYESVFQVTLQQLDNPESLNPKDFEIWTFPMEKESGGSGGALVRMNGFSSGQNSVLIYFGCADCSVEVERVKKAGGRVEHEKFSIGQYGFIAHVYDTEGNMIGLHSME